MIATNTPTRYEIVLAKQDKSLTYRIPLWTVAKGRRQVQNAVWAGDNWERIIALTGEDEVLEWDSKAQAFVGNDWIVRASGRTQRDAEANGLLPILPTIS